MQVFISLRINPEYRPSGFTTMVIFDLTHMTGFGRATLHAQSWPADKVMRIVYEWLDEHCEYRIQDGIDTAIYVKSGEDAALIKLRFDGTQLEV